MKRYILLAALAVIAFSCKKDKENEPETPASCDMVKVYADNAAKQTISTGIWGTVASMEGNCMPIVGGTSTCKTCPVKRKVRIYEYTLLSQTLPKNNIGPFFDSFTTKLIKEIETDDNGFYQADIAPGNYTIVTIENGKLYASGLDGVGGLNPVNFTTGAVKINLLLTNKAVF